MQEKNRFKLTIEYDGSGLAGWQAQDNSYSVQEALQSSLFKATGQEIEVTGAGRTDAGVHALGQVAHLDLENWNEFKLKEAMNFYLRHDKKLPLPQQIAVINAEIAPAEFHARFDAIKRHYLYRIINRREHLTLEANRAWHIIEELNVEKMQGAARILLGKHDFSSFRSSECQAKSPVKTLDEIEITQNGTVIEFNISARSFLHHQVRNIVGSLRLIGNGKWQVEDLKKALAAQDRKCAGETAPAHGLYLIKIDY